MKKRVLIGFLGTSRDAAAAPWGATLTAVQQPDFKVDRLELLHETKFSALASEVTAKVKAAVPHTKVVDRLIGFKDPWNFEEVYAGLLDFARSYPFDTAKEDYFLHVTTGTHVIQICWFLLAEAKFIPAQLLQTVPPEAKGPRIRVIDLDLDAYRLLAARFKQRASDAIGQLKNGIETRNPAFNRLMQEMLAVAVSSPEPILLLGPTGAGKTELARRIYELRRKQNRMKGALVEVNCATLGTLASTTLFGHSAGAFTNAVKSQDGLLLAAHEGLLFLDEIGDLGLEQQGQLLKAIEDKRFRPVGSLKEIHTDFQLIAGTNRDLSTDVATGRFRADLLARINLWTWQLPGLAQRREDIEPNLDYELNRATMRLAKPTQMSPSARKRYLEFAMQAPWKANFRDLGSSVMRMATLAGGDKIDEKHVQAEITRLQADWHTEGPVSSGRCEKYLGANEARKLDRFVRIQLEDVLAVCETANNLSEAGRVLFAESRKTKKSANDADRLKKYLAGHGLDWAQLKHKDI